MLALLIGGHHVLGGLLLAVPRRNVPLMPLVLTLAAAGATWLASCRRLVVGRLALTRSAGVARTSADARVHTILPPAMELSALRVAGLDRRRCS